MWSRHYDDIYDETKELLICIFNLWFKDDTGLVDKILNLFSERQILIRWNHWPVKSILLQLIFIKLNIHHVKKCEFVWDFSFRNNFWSKVICFTYMVYICSILSLLLSFLFVNDVFESFWYHHTNYFVRCNQPVLLK